MGLSEQQRGLRKLVRDFATKELATHDAATENEEFPRVKYGRLADLGLTGLGIPEALGGQGGGLVEACIAIEEVAAKDPSLSLALVVSLSLTTMGLVGTASDEQKARYVPPLASGARIGAFAYTEPEAGSDAAALQTRAVRQGDSYVLNGVKTFITNGDVADTYYVFATMDPALRHRGITGFIVEGGTPGLRTTPMKGKLGMRGSSTAEVVFDHCEVPAANRVGDEGQGFKLAMRIVDGSRSAIGAQAVGIAQGAMDMATRYTGQRRQFGRAIADNQGVQWMLADMATGIEAARLLVYRAASLRDQGRPCTTEAAMGKLFASQTAVRVTNAALQLHGGYGYFEESGVEGLYRDAKATEIYEGTSQIQRLVIARGLLERMGRSSP